MTWTRVVIEVDVDGEVDNSWDAASEWADVVMGNERVFAASIHFDGQHLNECDGEACNGCLAASPSGPPKVAEVQPSAEAGRDTAAGEEQQ